MKEADIGSQCLETLSEVLVEEGERPVVVILREIIQVAEESHQVVHQAVQLADPTARHPTKIKEVAQWV